MRLFMTIVLLIIFNYSHGQYLDGKGALARLIERKMAEKVRDNVKATALAYSLTEATTLVENFSKSRLYATETSQIGSIDYNNYKYLCDYYVSPFKKSKCNNKFNYLKEAHLQLLSLLKFSSLSKINKGVKEQIFIKYTSIINQIFLELEKLKMEADQETFYRQRILNLGKN